MQKSRSCVDVLLPVLTATPDKGSGDGHVKDEPDDEEDEDEACQSASAEEGDEADDASSSGHSSADDNSGQDSAETDTDTADTNADDVLGPEAASAAGADAATASSASSFFIDFGGTVAPAKRGGALQKSFASYLRRRKLEARQEAKAAASAHQAGGAAAPMRSSPERMRALRARFLERCKHYFGVPYKQKYWTEADPEYNSPLFLDCCGLVRRVLYDMRKEFGFKIGPWNQAYMFDTLPVRLTEDTMQPGDLVFIEAIYYSETAKKQRHNMVHVEVWLGDGPKTIGARWQKGKVQVFDSYKFVSTSYHSQVHHFRSIDTWLQGICRSFCPDHPWRRYATTCRSNKYSIFKAGLQNPDSAKTDQKKKRKKKKRRRRKKKEKCGDKEATVAAPTDAAESSAVNGSSTLRSVASLPLL